MEKNEIDRLLEGRRITEEYERDYPTQGEDAVWAFVAKIKELGFNSPKLFFDWNREMNERAFAECRPLIVGTCDFCEGIEGMQQCQRTLKGICPQVKNGMTKEAVEQWYSLPKLVSLMVSWIGAGIFKVNMDKGKCPLVREESFCPPGRGIRVDKNNTKNLPFDISWTRRKTAGMDAIQIADYMAQIIEDYVKTAIVGQAALGHKSVYAKIKNVVTINVDTPEPLVEITLEVRRDRGTPREIKFTEMLSNLAWVEQSRLIGSEYTYI